MGEGILGNGRRVARPDLCQDLEKGHAFHKLHRVKRPALFIHGQIVDRHDVRVLQLPGQFGFLGEPAEDQRVRHCFLESDLHGHRPLDVEILGLENRTHATACYFLAHRVKMLPFFNRLFRGKRQIGSRGESEGCAVGGGRGPGS